MSNVQYLNLDELPTTVDRTIRLNGIEHVMEVPTVERFISQQRKAKEFEAVPADQRPVGYELSQICVLISDAFPTLTIDCLKALGMNKLNAIIAFINTKIEDVVKAAAAEMDPDQGK